MQQMEKPASQRQMAYIERLKNEIGVSVPGIGDELTSLEASRIIDQLIGKVGQNGTGSGQMKINEPRLGMAMKECYREWSRLGRDVLRNKRKAFIAETISMYFLFTEIAEIVQRNSQMAGKAMWLSGSETAEIADAKA